MLYEKRAKENKTASASAYFEGGKYIYKKIWDVDAQTAEQTNILEFEGVYQNARISLNGNQIAERPYGYTNFYVDLTDLLTVGQNEIQVIADNADVPNSRWYSGSGIYRPVSLYTAGSSYIKPEGIKVQVLDQECICLRLACVAENAHGKDHDSGSKCGRDGYGRGRSDTLGNRGYYDHDTECETMVCRRSASLPGKSRTCAGRQCA